MVPLPADHICPRRQDVYCQTWLVLLCDLPAGTIHWFRTIVGSDVPVDVSHSDRDVGLEPSIATTSRGSQPLFVQDQCFPVFPPIMMETSQVVKHSCQQGGGSQPPSNGQCFVQTCCCVIVKALSGKCQCQILQQVDDVVGALHLPVECQRSLQLADSLGETTQPHQGSSDKPLRVRSPGDIFRVEHIHRGLCFRNHILIAAFEQAQQGTLVVHLRQAGCLSPGGESRLGVSKCLPGMLVVKTICQCLAVIE